MIPRGIRNNNPLNIRRSKDQWQGMKKPQVPPLYHQGDTGKRHGSFTCSTRRFCRPADDPSWVTGG